MDSSQHDVFSARGAENNVGGSSSVLLQSNGKLLTTRNTPQLTALYLMATKSGGSSGEAMCGGNQGTPSWEGG